MAAQIQQTSQNKEPLSRQENKNVGTQVNTLNESKVVEILGDGHHIQSNELEKAKKKITDLIFQLNKKGTEINNLRNFQKA